MWGNGKIELWRYIFCSENWTDSELHNFSEEN